MPPKDKNKSKIPPKRSRMVLSHKVTQTAQHAQARIVQSPPKRSRIRPLPPPPPSPPLPPPPLQGHISPSPTTTTPSPPSKIPPKRSRMVLLHKVTQTAQHAQARIVQSPPKRSRIRPLPPPPPSPPLPPPSLQGHISPSPTTTTPSPPSTSISSRHTQPRDDTGPSVPVPSGPTSQGSRHSHHDLETAADGRPYIFPLAKGWSPCRVASRALTKVIESQFRDPYTSWGEIPSPVVDYWFKKFGEKVAWRPEHEYQLKTIFTRKGSKRLSEMLLDARKKEKRPTWIGESAWTDLTVKWEAPSFKEKSVRAKQNRASTKGGAVHTGGSITITEHARRMARELGREPTLDEVFLKTHQKKDSSWVDNRAKETYETFQQKLQQASQREKTSGSDSKEVDPATRLDLWVESAGGKTRGRLYGAGDLSSRYRLGVTSLTQESHASASSSQVPAQYSAEMAAQLAALEARARAAEEDARQAREAIRLAEERTEQTTADFQRQLRELAASVAAIQSQSTCRPRHPDYEEDESDGEDH